jgi:hypothetical protein
MTEPDPTPEDCSRCTHPVESHHGLITTLQPLAGQAICLQPACTCNVAWSAVEDGPDPTGAPTC